MAFKADWNDYVPNADGLKYKLTQNDDGTYKIEDVTTYTVVGDKLTAAQLNAIGNALNSIESDISSIKQRIIGIKYARYKFPEKQVLAQNITSFEATQAAMGIPDNGRVVSILIESTGWTGLVPQHWSPNLGAKTVYVTLYNATQAAHTVGPVILAFYYEEGF